MKKRRLTLTPIQFDVTPRDSFYLSIRVEQAGFVEVRGLVRSFPQRNSKSLPYKVMNTR